MASQRTIDTLNRLLAIHHRSLPMYLDYATPWMSSANGEVSATLGSIVESQKEFVDRFGELVMASGGAVRYGEFPMVFTGYHDVSFEWLLPKLIERQEREIQIIEQCVSQLDDAIAKAAAEESLGAAKAHLDALNELR